MNVSASMRIYYYFIFKVSKWYIDRSFGISRSSHQWVIPRRRDIHACGLRAHQDQKLLECGVNDLLAAHNSWKNLNQPTSRPPWELTLLSSAIPKLLFVVESNHSSGQLSDSSYSYALIKPRREPAPAPIKHQTEHIQLDPSHPLHTHVLGLGLCLLLPDDKQRDARTLGCTDSIQLHHRCIHQSLQSRRRGGQHPLLLQPYRQFLPDAHGSKFEQP